MTYSIGHTLITPLPDGRVSYTPCRHCGDPCRGHSMAGRIEMQEVPVGAWCRTCGAECPRAQCDACRADGAALALERSACGHLVAEIEGREGSTRWCAGCEREARVRDEERAAIVAWLRGQCATARRHAASGSGDDSRHAAAIAIVLGHSADAIERGDHRS